MARHWRPKALQCRRGLRANRTPRVDRRHQTRRRESLPPGSCSEPTSDMSMRPATRMSRFRSASPESPCVCGRVARTRWTRTLSASPTEHEPKAWWKPNLWTADIRDVQVYDHPGSSGSAYGESSRLIVIPFAGIDYRFEQGVGIELAAVNSGRHRSWTSTWVRKCLLCGAAIDGQRGVELPCRTRGGRVSVHVREECLLRAISRNSFRSQPNRELPCHNSAIDSCSPPVETRQHQDEI